MSAMGTFRLSANRSATYPLVAALSAETLPRRILSLEATLSVWFKVLAGDEKGRLIFMNQVITQKFQVHICNDFLRSLDSGIDVKFLDFGQYAQLIMDIHEAIDGKLEYSLKYGETKKGFNTFDIEEVYEAE